MENRWFLLTTKRDRVAAKHFFDKAMQANDVPEKVTMDKSDANKATIDDVLCEILIYAQNRFIAYLVVCLQACKIIQMTEKIQFLIHFFVMLAKFIRPGGKKIVMADLLLKQQLMMLARQRSREP